jgi:S1-C subfamily serine protease
VSVIASAEAMRIVRTVESYFPTGPQKSGSAFVAGSNGQVVTCAHVVVNDAGERANRVLIGKPDGTRLNGKVVQVNRKHDLARIDTSDTESPPQLKDSLPQLGEQVVFAGQPQGVAQPSVFPGMVSAVGRGLLRQPRCELIQIAGMINNGNSGGPLLESAAGEVIGVITAKYVPLLQEIDRLAQMLENIPQYPSDVALGQIDFAKFVNVTIKSMWQFAAVLRLVQVGTGWAIPARYFEQVGVV